MINFNTLTKGQIVDLYLDYTNNFLTVSRFAEHYGLHDWQANKVINLGRKFLTESNNK